MRKQSRLGTMLTVFLSASFYSVAHAPSHAATPSRQSAAQLDLQLAGAVAALPLSSIDPTSTTSTSTTSTTSPTSTTSTTAPPARKQSAQASGDDVWAKL